MFKGLIFIMLKVRELTKKFGHKSVVNRVFFTLKKEEIVGYLRPNGAGKLTTVKMHTGLLEPSFG
jgi:ABC-type multidrug transport system ATPase subunit